MGVEDNGSPLLHTCSTTERALQHTEHRPDYHHHHGHHGPQGEHSAGCLVRVWSGLVWFGLVWSGLVWSGLVWFGLVWFGLVWFGLVWSGLVWYVVLMCFSLFASEQPAEDGAWRGHVGWGPVVAVVAGPCRLGLGGARW